MFEGVLPAAARWALAPADVTVADLWDDERSLVVAAVPARARELAAGRVAARRALAALGEPPAAIPAVGRRPCWPAGIVGSITHCAGLAAAAVARTADLRALGIDAEPAIALDAAVADIVATAAERARLDSVLTGTVVFSAKEAFYKCWSAAGGGLLEFDDVELLLDADGGFEARPPGHAGWPGRWAVVDGYVVSAAWILP